MRLRLHRFHKPYLLLLSTLQIPPLLCYVAEVHLIHGHLDVANGIVFGKAVKVVHRHHQRLPAELYIGDLEKTTAVTGHRGFNTLLSLVRSLFSRVSHEYIKLNVSAGVS